MFMLGLLGVIPTYFMLISAVAMVVAMLFSASFDERSSFAPLNPEEIEEASDFYYRHPEYGEFIAEVRRQGREMLLGELRALQADAAARRQKEARNHLYRQES
jgi:hypothetical protein